MNGKLFALILGSVGLSAIAQLVLKSGMSSIPVQQAINRGMPFELACIVALNPYVLVGLALYLLGAAVWLLVLAQTDVSLAYPFVGIGFILTMLLGWLILHEPLGTARVIGTLLVVAGVWLVSSS